MIQTRSVHEHADLIGAIVQANGLCFFKFFEFVENKVHFCYDEVTVFIESNPLEVYYKLPDFLSI